MRPQYCFWKWLCDFIHSVNTVDHIKWRGRSKRLALVQKYWNIFMPVSIVELRLLYGCNRMQSKHKRRYTSGGKRCNTHFKHHFQLIPTFTQPSQSTTDTLLTGCSIADEHQKTGRRGMETGPHSRPRPQPASALIQDRSPWCLLPSAKQPKMDNYSSLHSPTPCYRTVIVLVMSPNNSGFTLTNERWKGLFMYNRYRSHTR